MNKQYGLWAVINGRPIRRDNKIYLLCRCRCGTERQVIKKNLRSGISTSCGCVRSANLTKRNTKHGMRFTKEWRAWQAMKNRCRNPNFAQYKHYGGRGIRICPEWVDSFDSFYKYVGKSPQGSSLDRIDNDGHYEPGNVRWSNPRQQNRNRSSNAKIGGMCISDISRNLGGSHSLVRKRLNRGWSVERAITEPTQHVNTKNNSNRKV